jgi:hypothetical protein
MRTAIHRVLGAMLCALALAVPASAQDFRGRINGTVTDGSGAVLPGVTVTATSPALIQPQVAVTSDDGAYRLIALPAGLYELTFELPGFRTLKRDGIRVVIGQTLSINGQLDVATLEETVTVSGESPVVDTSTTTVGTNFTKELLTEIPNARDIWAAMSQARVQMGYDVGGSHAGTQTGFVAYGVASSARRASRASTPPRAPMPTPATSISARSRGFQLGGRAAAPTRTRRAADEHHRQVGRRPAVGIVVQRLAGRRDDCRQRARRFQDDRRRARRFKAPTGGAAATRSTRHDLNGNVGGPIHKGKAWFFYSYRLNNPVHLHHGHRPARAVEAHEPRSRAPTSSRATTS